MKKANISLDSLTPFFEKIETLSQVQRISICVGAFLILIGAFVYFSFLPKFEKINNLTKEFNELEQKLAAAKRNASQLEALRKKMKEAEIKFKIAKKALPEKEEIPSLLTGISKAGQDAGLEFLLFQPESEIKKDFYAEIPVSISVTGKYHNVAIFFDKIARLSRIVNIKNVNMTPLNDDELSTKCTAVTYMFVEDSGQGQKK